MFTLMSENARSQEAVEQLNASVLLQPELVEAQFIP